MGSAMNTKRSRPERTSLLQLLEARYFSDPTPPDSPLFAPGSPLESVQFLFGSFKAARGREVIALNVGGGGLDRLLRHHRDGEVQGPELELRAAIDDLLAFHSVVEVAAILDLLPEPLPRAFAKPALRELEQPAVRRYYEGHYPMPLPGLLRQRLRGEQQRKEWGAALPLDSFNRFISLSDRVDADVGVKLFLSLLDDFTWTTPTEQDPVTWGRLLAILGDREKLLPRLAVPGAERGIVERALYGFGGFLTFAFLFHTFLEAHAGAPLFQSAAWHYHAYWFQKLREPNTDMVPVNIRGRSDAVRAEQPRIFTAITLLLAGLDDREAVAAPLVSLDFTTEQVRQSLTALSSDRYEAALLAAGPPADPLSAMLTPPEPTARGRSGNPAPFVLSDGELRTADLRTVAARPAGFSALGKRLFYDDQPVAVEADSGEAAGGWGWRNGQLFFNGVRTPLRHKDK